MGSLLDWPIILKLLLAAFFGSTVGVERYVHGRPAGLRTYLLVCVAFAAVAVLSERISLLNEPLSLGALRPDPGRLMAGALTGIGFLGAGIILRGGVTIHGLTTAAGIWAISVVGLALGAGSYGLAATLYVMTLLSLMGLRQIEVRLNKDIYKTIVLSVQKPGVTEETLGNIYQRNGLRVITVDRSEDRSTQTLTYRYTLNGKKEESFHEAYQELASLKETQSIQLKGDTLGKGQGFP